MPLEVAKLLWDMQNAAQRIEEFAAGKTLGDFKSDALLRSGIERQFEIIGEAMTRLLRTDASVAAKISDSRKISGFRNVLIHGYDSIDDEISWGIVQDKLPILRREIDELLRVTGA